MQGYMCARKYDACVNVLCVKALGEKNKQKKKKREKDRAAG
jgi:hypothetical protein